MLKDTEDYIAIVDKALERVTSAYKLNLIILTSFFLEHCQQKISKIDNLSKWKKSSNLETLIDEGEKIVLKEMSKLNLPLIKEIAQRVKKGEDLRPLDILQMILFAITKLTNSEPAILWANSLVESSSYEHKNQNPYYNFTKDLEQTLKALHHLEEVKDSLNELTNISEKAISKKSTEDTLANSSNDRKVLTDDEKQEVMTLRDELIQSNKKPYIVNGKPNKSAIARRIKQMLNLLCSKKTIIRAAFPKEI